MGAPNFTSYTRMYGSFRLHTHFIISESKENYSYYVYKHPPKLWSAPATTSPSADPPPATSAITIWWLPCCGSAWRLWGGGQQDSEEWAVWQDWQFLVCLTCNTNIWLGILSVAQSSGLTSRVVKAPHQSQPSVEMRDASELISNDWDQWCVLCRGLWGRRWGCSPCSCGKLPVCRRGSFSCDRFSSKMTILLTKVSNGVKIGGVYWLLL